MLFNESVITDCEYFKRRKTNNNINSNNNKFNNNNNKNNNITIRIRRMTLFQEVIHLTAVT